MKKLGIIFLIWAGVIQAATIDPATDTITAGAFAGDGSALTNITLAATGSVDSVARAGVTSNETSIANLSNYVDAVKAGDWPTVSNAYYTSAQVDTKADSISNALTSADATLDFNIQSNELRINANSNQIDAVFLVASNATYDGEATAAQSNEFLTAEANYSAGDTIPAVDGSAITNLTLVNSQSPTGDGNTTANWTIDMTAGGLLIYTQNVAITGVFFTVSDTNNVEAAEVILETDANSITWPASIIWAEGSAPTTDTSDQERFVFSIYRGKIAGAYIEDD